MSAWVGGTQKGDRVDNQHDYYPQQVNKGAAAFTKGTVLSIDPATGNVRIAETAHPGPFFVAYEDSLISDPRQHCWKQEGVWLVLETASTLLPNARVVPVGGNVTDYQLTATTTADPDSVAGYYLGTIDLGQALTSGNVKQDSAAIGDLVVIDFRKV